MCGISGIFSSNGLQVDTSVIRRMHSSMIHRGPDAEGFFTDGHCNLAHNRLSIIDLSDRSNQPMTSSCGRYVMVYNGEVYNYSEIATVLSGDQGQGGGIRLKTSGDSEVILEAFAKYGLGFLELLNGMFAIAIYDLKEKVLWAFRDRVGIKPFYYALVNSHLYFSSELKAIEKAGAVSDELDHDAIAEYLQLGYVPAPATIYKQVRKLPAGCYLKCDSKGTSVHRYWDIRSKITNESHSDFQQVTVKLSDLFTSSVQYQLRSDVPYGVFLSGGVDSSLITAHSVMLSGSRIKTFSIGFEESKYNESHYARAVADYLNTDHHEFIVRYQDALDLVESMPDVFDEPFSDSSAIPTMLVSKLARSKVTVTLSGEGGDELFFGYGSHNWARRLGNPLISALRLPAVQLFSRMNDRFRRVSELLDYSGNDNLMRHIFSHEQYVFDRKQALGILKNKPSVKSPVPIVGDSVDVFSEMSYEWLENAAKLGLIKRKMSRIEMQALFDLCVYLQDDLLTKIDRSTMKYSLESRVPFLDHRLVEYSVNISPDLKFRKGVQKFILKEILYQYLPEKIFQRPKQGFSIPLKKWLRNELSYLIDTYLNPDAVRRHGILDEKAVYSLVSGFKAGNDLAYNRVWTILQLQMWLEGRFR